MVTVSGWFSRVKGLLMKKEKALRLDQFEKLTKLELVYQKEKLEFMPGKKRINNIPVYLIIRYKGVAIGEVFTNRVVEIVDHLSVGDRSLLKDEDYTKIEKILNKIKAICQG